MIQPITYSNITFSGQVNVSMKYDKSKGVDEILSKIPNEEDRAIFEEEFDTFKREIEEKTPEDSSFTIELDYDDWLAGGVLKSGKSVIFDIKDSKYSTEKSLHKGELPLLRKNGELWKEGKNFKGELRKFFKGSLRTALDSFFFRKAVEDARTPKAKPKKSLLDEFS